MATLKTKWCFTRNDSIGILSLNGPHGLMNKFTCQELVKVFSLEMHEVFHGMCLKRVHRQEK